MTFLLLLLLFLNEKNRRNYNNIVVGLSATASGNPKKSRETWNNSLGNSIYYYK